MDRIKKRGPAVTATVSGMERAPGPDPLGSGPRRGRPPIIDPARLAELWSSGAPAGEIADTLGVGRQAVHDAVRRHGLPPRGRGTRLPVDQWRRLEAKGATVAEIAETTGHSETAVREGLRAGVERDRYLEKLRAEGWTVAQIAEELGVSTRTASRHLRRAGLT